MEESPLKELHELEARQISDIEFKTMVIKILKELSDSYNELSGNYNTVHKEIENY